MVLLVWVVVVGTFPRGLESVEGWSWPGISGRSRIEDRSSGDGADEVPVEMVPDEIQITS